MITKNLRKNLIQQYNDIISRFLLNENIEIGNYELIIEDTVLIVQFPVPEGITEIKRIRLFQENMLLSDSTLYVPINGDTIFKYKAEVIELGN